MALILLENLGTIKDTKGNYRKIGYFKCSFCENIIKRRLDTIAKSCGCKTNELISEATKGENNPMYGIISPMYGKQHTKEAKQKQSESKKGSNNPMYGKNFTIEHRQNLSESHLGDKSFWYGKNFTIEHRQNLSESHIGIFLGELSPNWQGGKSFEIYPIEFKQIKEFILERDNYICQNTNCQIENPKRLDCHHIDYDKKNNNPENLITLCINCHMKTNYNRGYFTEFYNNLINERMI